MTLAVRTLAARTLAVLALTGGAFAAPLVGTAAAHGPNQDGCSFSPDEGFTPAATYYNFHAACDQHDLCYTNHPFGGGDAGRLACDDTFRANMYYWCDNAYRNNDFPRNDCRNNAANAYYTAVRWFAGPAF